MFVAQAYQYRFAYPYDLPSLALLFAAFAAFLRQRHATMLALFALASLSRETSLLLIAVAALWPWPPSRPARIARLAQLAAMAALWLAAYTCVHTLYAANPRESTAMGQIGTPGGMVIELGNNWQDLRDPYSWPALLSIFSFLWVPVCLGWNQLRHPGLRRVILYVTPAWWLLMFTVGRLREVRVFAELTMIYWLAAVTIYNEKERKMFFFEKKNQKTFAN
jgi:hypothetical protein